MFWFLSLLLTLFCEFCEGVCRLLMRDKSGLSSVMGFKFVGSGFRLVAGKGFRAFESVLRVVGIGLTSEDSRQELATSAILYRGDN